MLAYVLTAIAGIAIGIVAARIWLARDPGPTPSTVPVSHDAPAKAGASGKRLPFATIALVAAAAIALVSIAVTYFRGDEPSAPIGPQIAAGGSAPVGSAMTGLDDVDVMIDRLAKRLETAPDDGEGFRMLGWSYVNTGKADKAIPAYKRALELLPNRADVHAGYGEALVDVTGGTVTPAAKSAFDQAIKLDPKEPRARYFQALYQAQHGDQKGALDAWIALANDGPADAPWQGDLHQRITETAAKLKVDVTGRLQPTAPQPAGPATAPPPIDAATVEAASALPATDRQAMVDKMVDGLAAKLAANPNDPDGWIRLLRSRMVLKQTDQAARDLASARVALVQAPADLARVDAAARDLGVPGN